MNEASLPQLLEALGELFLAPGAFDAPVFRAGSESAWTTPALRQALKELLDAPREELAVRYAGRFLLGATAPTIHLEASAWGSGALQDPKVMGSLAPLYSLAGIEAREGVQADHLGALLLLFAHLLRRLLVCPEGESAQLESAARELLQESLVPLAGRVRSALNGQDDEDAYRAAGRVLGATLDLSRQVLA